MSCECPNTFDVLSLFPAMLDGFIGESILARAIRKNLLSVKSHSIRKWATGKHSITDDRPFGGGAGMVMKPEPLAGAIGDLRGEKSLIIYLCPDGEPFSTAMARDLVREEHIILLCGHYEGIDERIREKYVQREISIGDYVLTNGVIAAAVVIDAVARHIPGVLGDFQSLEQDSFSDGLLAFPQYTRPEIFEGMEVPKILMGGHHKKIDQWRQEQRIRRTRQRRMDMIGGMKNE
ncbi:MAG: tRNA (guanosine(37)-N1)-methyltransferase TrmD [Puniceicoccales bacterium]|jgi:tRNA (guanine37-N1)-methyltransferase|nr:tRNA (guanosine(37)-N1)-methyltransferase TrmD [Puniceicoccales bacterium]